jgi:hypothetical protein
MLMSMLRGPNRVDSVALVLTVSGQAKHRQTGCQFLSFLDWISRGNRITVINPMQKEEQDVAMTNNDD